MTTETPATPEVAIYAATISVFVPAELDPTDRAGLAIEAAETIGELADSERIVQDIQNAVAGAHGVRIQIRSVGEEFAAELGETETTELGVDEDPTLARVAAALESIANALTEAGQRGSLLDRLVTAIDRNTNLGRR